MENIVEKLKQYWWVLALAVVGFLFFTKKGKKLMGGTKARVKRSRAYRKARGTRWGKRVSRRYRRAKRRFRR